MARSKKRTSADENTVNLELTSPQLVWGIAFLLFIMLASFTLGYIVGRFNPSNMTERTPVARKGKNSVVKPQASPPGAKRQKRSSRKQGKQTSPRIVSTSSKGKGRPGSSTVDMTAVSSGTKPTTGGKKASKTVAEPLPEIQPVRLPGPEAAFSSTKKPEPETPPSSMTKTEPPLKKKEPEKPVVKVPEPVKKEPATTKKPAKEKLKVAKAPVSKNKYTVQVAAYSVPENASNAKRRLEENTKYKARLHKSGKWTLVLIGDFKDSKSAGKVRDELRKRPGLSGSFVLKAPK